MPQLPKHILDEMLHKLEVHAANYKQIQLVFDIFVNSEYRRTFVNQVQINEFCKQIWNRDKFAIVEIVPVERDYVEG